MGVKDIGRGGKVSSGATGAGQMSNIEVGYVNVFESATVLVTSAAAGYPGYRLYDRFLGKMWQATGVEDQIISADQGGGVPQAVDTLAIPAGHNLAGATLYLEYSSDNIKWFKPPGVPSWGQPDNNLIFKQMSAPQSYRFWRFRIVGPSVAPMVGEIFLTLLYAFSPGAQPSITTSSTYGNERNVIRNRPKSGLVQFLLCGNPARFRTYFLEQCNDADLAVLQALDSAWQGTLPFLFIDHAGAVFFAELLADTASAGTDEGLRYLVFSPKETWTAVQLQVLEVTG